MSQANIDKAHEYHFSGACNCAQAVASAYAEDMGLDRATTYRLLEAMGGGVGGRHDGVCGAFSGAAAVIGWYISDGSFEGNTKKKTYEVVKEASELFIQKAGNLVCQDILDTLDKDNPKKCSPIVRIGAEVVEEILDKYELR